MPKYACAARLDGIRTSCYYCTVYTQLGRLRYRISVSSDVIDSEHLPSLPSPVRGGY